MRTHMNINEMTDREYRSYKRRMRIRRERRHKAMMVVITFCLILFGTISYQSITSSAKSGEQDIMFKYYTNITVTQGETLWDIANEYIDYEQYKDIDSYIDEVRSINHIDENSVIRIGQNLIVPYFSNVFVK